ncbi:MAG: dolichol kinase [Ignavibacteriota bacterium]|nr:MAG: dolichol kinase [Chlorobiota bacterium]MBE7476785.1 dolichol kinase [Ignavibacteriales bacterium]MBL1121962.1 dolichol kinase [Ignavibacteriota bacterium]MCC7095081.1 dolichol kinase [Ignavibacteriaceae bacterium]MCE7857981.1 dolichol kinase [Ignavibacteria bacterium CHB3]MEB2295005.1 SEC59/DGK1/VTE5 family protein [Ignavibacteria bacterium]
MTQIDNGTIQYKDELFRKLIHLTSLSIPIVYYFITAKTAAIILGILTAAALIIDLSRYLHPETGKIFYKFFGFLLREHELDHKKKNLNGATYVLISALISVLIFPKVIFISAFSILIISDSLAALIGRKFGKHKFLSKSFEGTLTFFISACIVILFTPKIGGFLEEYLIGFIAAFVGAIVENISFRLIDDNLSIPLSVGFTMWGLYLALLPNLELTLSNVSR